MTNNIDRSELLIPSDPFHQLISRIQNNVFVSQDTKEMRTDVKDWFSEAKRKFAEIGIDDVVFIPTGSVAVGMASFDENSDVDGKVYYYAKTQEQEDMANRLVNEINLPERHNPFITFSSVRMMLEYFQQDIQTFAFNKDINSLVRFALLFAPTLNECMDIQESKTIDVWRKSILTYLSTLPEQQGKTVWEKMSEWLGQQYIRYEQSEGGDTQKRERRVQTFIQQALSSRFDDNAKKMRAERMIQSWRTNLNYPTYEEMLKTFHV